MAPPVAASFAMAYWRLQPQLAAKHLEAATSHLPGCEEPTQPCQEPCLEPYLEPEPCPEPCTDVGFEVSTATPCDVLWTLAQDPAGSRGLQRAIEEPCTNADRIAYAQCLRGKVWEAMRCKHANHFVQKCVESMPPSAVQFVIDEIFLAGPRAVQRAARQKYGCRVLQRLLEHCPLRQVSSVADELLTEAVRLSVHQYGNFVMSSLAVYGSDEQRRQLMRCIIPEVEAVGSNLNGCAVLSQLLSHDASPELRELCESLLRVNGLVAQMSRKRYGHQVVANLADQFQDQHAKSVLLCEQLREGVAELSTSRYGRSLITKFNLQHSANIHVSSSQATAMLRSD